MVKYFDLFCRFIYFHLCKIGLTLMLINKIFRHHQGPSSYENLILRLWKRVVHTKIVIISFGRHWSVSESDLKEHVHYYKLRICKRNIWFLQIMDFSL